MIGVTGLHAAMEEAMPTLTIGTRPYSASNARVVREADGMFKWSPERRVTPAEARQISFGSKGSPEDLPATKAAVAIILGQGVTNI
jgi:hypothetical protein